MYTHIHKNQQQQQAAKQIIPSLTLFKRVPTIQIHNSPTNQLNTQPALVILPLFSDLLCGPFYEFFFSKTN